MHKCIVCGNKTEYYFEKNFNSSILDNATYYRCLNCGFVYSEKHYSMPENDWKKINENYHLESYDISKKFFEHKPPYLYQALFLYILAKNNFINVGNWLDYGAGLGNFSNILKQYFNLEIISYDKYFNPNLSIQPKTCDVVFSSAVLEHITSIEPIDFMINALKSNGTFIFHTLVCENVPQDSNWFYLLPVHCSFFTNKSMALLMKKYGFTCSIYSPNAKTWALFQEKPDAIKEKVEKLNIELMSNYLYFKNDFVDYWKGF